MLRILVPGKNGQVGCELQDALAALGTVIALDPNSTDDVFDGELDRPYSEDDPPNPVNTYGKTTLAGERAIEAVGGH